MSATATCWEDAYRVQTERISELWRENAALREDKERLDWLLKLEETERVKFCRGWYRWTIEEVKAAIDAGRKEAQP